MKAKLISIILFLIFTPALVLCEDLDLKDHDRYIKLIDASSTVYSDIVKGANGEISSNILKNARCIVIIPSVVTGAVVPGTTLGKGVTCCKDLTGVWSRPIPITFKQGSLSTQAGTNQTDLVLFLQSKESEAAFRKGKLKLGDDADVLAGNYEKNIELKNSGVVLYSRVNGVFSGVAINGTVIEHDKEEFNDFYGKNFSIESALNNSENPDVTGYSKKLTDMFPIDKPSNA